MSTTTNGPGHIRSDGNSEIVPNADGERMTPSVVYFDRHEDIKLVGSTAHDSGDPDRTIHLNPNYVVEMDGKKWTPTEISALILAKMKRD